MVLPTSMQTGVATLVQFLLLDGPFEERFVTVKIAALLAAVGLFDFSAVKKLEFWLRYPSLDNDFCSTSFEAFFVQESVWVRTGTLLNDLDQACPLGWRLSAFGSGA